MSAPKSIQTDHEDLIHDVAYDFYGERLATCSSDQSVKVRLLFQLIYIYIFLSLYPFYFFFKIYIFMYSICLSISVFTFHCNCCFVWDFFFFFFQLNYHFICSLLQSFDFTRNKKQLSLVLCCILHCRRYGREKKERKILASVDPLIVGPMNPGQPRY